MWKRILGYSYNLISLAGLVLAFAGAGLIVVFMAVGLISGLENPYLGIFIYFVFPCMLILGLLLIPIGIIRARRRMLRQGVCELQPFPILDLNVASQRRKAEFFVLATVVFFFIIAVASIKGYEYTESVVFCGQLCHTVMKPEYTAWSASPHARVRCAECHIGPGAEWFVKTKLSGLRQVYKVMTNTYPRPVETPIPNLRPARETCEGCHWPEKFYSGRQKVFYHYASDEKNTPREIDMLLKLGRAPKDPNAQGIHWHIGREVTYLARDSKRQDIHYVAVKRKDGTVTEFLSTEKPPTREEIARGGKRLMDCIDCHNRPSHIFHAPGREIDENIVSGRIDPSLPFIKKVSVELLNKEYKTESQAYDAIAKGIRKYYAEKYPEVAGQKSAAVEKAVLVVQDIYGRNYFPVMKVKWNTHADNIGHFYFPGCFRCHDGKHRSADGRTISRDCNLCHQVLGQKQENIPPGTRVGEFVHPVDIGDSVKTTGCYECHQAGEM
jgi:hypothetical protein